MNNNNKKYGHDAQSYAVNASLSAQIGDVALKEWDRLKKSFSVPQDIMHDVLIVIFNVFFLAVSVAEVAVSFEMYAEIAGRNSHSIILVFVIAAIVVLWALAASHLIAPKISKKIRQFNVQRLVYQGEIQSVAEDKVAREIQKYFKVGLVAAFSVVLFVLALSYLRIEALAKINPEITYSWLDIFLPSQLVCLEILTGFYLAYFILRLTMSMRIRKAKALYEHYKLTCHAETQRAVASYYRALEANENVPLSKELTDSLYRYGHKSLAMGDYLEPITDTNHVSENGQKVKRARFYWKQCPPSLKMG